MTSHCAGTVQINERRVRKRDKKVRRDDCDLRRQQKMEREGAAVTCDGRLFHRRDYSGCNRKRSVTDSGQTSRLREESFTALERTLTV